MTEDSSLNQNKAHSEGDDEIEALLSQIKPLPGKRFYQKMENAPWQPQPSRPGLRQWALATILLVLVLGSTFTIPTVQAAAWELLHFFMPALSDQRTVQAHLPLPGSQVESYYGLNLADAQKEVGYSLKRIDQLPADLTFRGAHVDPSLKTVALRYSNGQEDLIFIQYPIGSIKEYSSIGASATVEPVQVDGVQGEMVSGAWRLQPTKPTIQDTSLPGTPTDLGLYWDPSLPQHMLRWQQNGMAFELLFTGESIGKTALIEIANNIQ